MNTTKSWQPVSALPTSSGHSLPGSIPSSYQTRIARVSQLLDDAEHLAHVLVRIAGKEVRLGAAVCLDGRLDGRRQARCEAAKREAARGETAAEGALGNRGAAGAAALRFFRAGAFRRTGALRRAGPLRRTAVFRRVGRFAAARALASGSGLAASHGAATCGCLSPGSLPCLSPPHGFLALRFAGFRALPLAGFFAFRRAGFFAPRRGAVASPRAWRSSGGAASCFASPPAGRSSGRRVALSPRFCPLCRGSPLRRAPARSALRPGGSLLFLLFLPCGRHFPTLLPSCV